MNPEDLAVSALELDAVDFEYFLRELAAAMEKSGEQSGDPAMLRAASKVREAVSEWVFRRGN